MFLSYLVSLICLLTAYTCQRRLINTQQARDRARVSLFSLVEKVNSLPEETKKEHQLQQATSQACKGAW